MRTPSENVRPVDDPSHAEYRPSTHDLLNDATMWLQYARGVTATLADLVHEAEELDCKQLSLSLEAIAAMTLRGLQKMSDARAEAHWDAVSSVKDTA